MKITKAIESKITELSEAKFVDAVVGRIIGQTFKQHEDRINHYVASEAEKLGKQIEKDFPL